MFPRRHLLPNLSATAWLTLRSRTLIRRPIIAKIKHRLTVGTNSWVEDQKAFTDDQQMELNDLLVPREFER